MTGRMAKLGEKTSTPLRVADGEFQHLVEGESIANVSAKQSIK